MMTRTTIRIHQSLLDTLRDRARKHRKSLTSELEDVLRRGLLEVSPIDEQIEIPVFDGVLGPQPGVDLTDTSKLLELCGD